MKCHGKARASRSQSGASFALLRSRGDARPVVANTFDCVVIGAGIHGLCTAFWLRQLGVRRVAVVEQFECGHTRGSSHGASRITRSSYAVPEFVALATKAHREGWPALERAVGRPLRTPTPGVFFGPGDGPIAAYIAATTGATDQVECLAVDIARRRFPLLQFDADDHILLDHTAATVHADATMASLREWLIEHDVELRWQTRVVHAEDQAGSAQLTTDRGEMAAQQIVLAGGAWSARLGGNGDRGPVLRQQIGYFELAAPTSSVRAGVFPVWARIGHFVNDFHYGLPATDDRGVKAAVHCTEGAHCDPDAEPPPIDTESLLTLARQRFAVPVHGLRASEHCIYTMAAGDRLQATRKTKRLVEVTACSGHSFKFAPVIGRIAADLVVSALR